MGATPGLPPTLPTSDTGLAADLQHQPARRLRASRPLKRERQLDVTGSFAGGAVGNADFSTQTTPWLVDPQLLHWQRAYAAHAAHARVHAEQLAQWWSYQQHAADQLRNAVP